MNSSQPPANCARPARAGNRLWEWFSVGRYGLKGYNFKEKVFEGEQWPEALGEYRACTATAYRQHWREGLPRPHSSSCVCWWAVGRRVAPPTAARPPRLALSLNLCRPGLPQGVPRVPGQGA